MDIKIAGITEEIMKVALAQASEGRAHILGEMAKALGETRTELSAHAPRIETFTIDKSKIREVIGTGGKVIREIVATTGASSATATTATTATSAEPPRCPDVRCIHASFGRAPLRQSRDHCAAVGGSGEPTWRASRPDDGRGRRPGGGTTLAR